MLQAISMHWRGNGSSENESNGNGSSSKAGFKANSEIIGNFRIFEKTLVDRVFQRKLGLQTEFRPTKRF